MGWGALFHHVLTEMELKEELFGVWVPLHPELLFSFVNLSARDLKREGGKERKKRRKGSKEGMMGKERGKEEKEKRKKHSKRGGDQTDTMYNPFYSAVIGF